jgi:hypothetical protein
LIIDLGCSGRYVVGAVKAKAPLQWRRQVMNWQENGSAWPRTRFGSLDVLADVSHELSAQIGDGGEDATGDDVALDPREPQFDLVEPGRVSRREVQPDTI